MLKKEKIMNHKNDDNGKRLSLVVTEKHIQVLNLSQDIHNIRKNFIYSFFAQNKLAKYMKEYYNLFKDYQLLNSLYNILKNSTLIIETDTVDNSLEPTMIKIVFSLQSRLYDEQKKKYTHCYKLEK